MRSRCLDFFLFGLGWGVRFFSFSTISNMFSSSSQWIPHGLTMFFNTTPITLPLKNKSHMLWQICPPLTYIDVPKWKNTTLLLICRILHVYSLSKNKVFVSYISHFKVECTFFFKRLSKLLTFKMIFSFLGQSINLL
jgi:hypothetical protein